MVKKNVALKQTSWHSFRQGDSDRLSIGKIYHAVLRVKPSQMIFIWKRPCGCYFGVVKAP